MEVCFEGIGQMTATFAAKKALIPGMAVTVTGNGEVGLGEEDGEPLCGVTVGAARGGAVAVQIGGVVKVSCSGDDAPQVGWQKLVCDGKGGVKTADGADGVKYLVLAVDEAEEENRKSVVVKL